MTVTFAFKTFGARDRTSWQSRSPQWRTTRRPVACQAPTHSAPSPHGRVAASTFPVQRARRHDHAARQHDCPRLTTALAYV
jgi:hypothetical protein